MNPYQSPWELPILGEISRAEVSTFVTTALARSSLAGTSGWRRSAGAKAAEWGGNETIIHLGKFHHDLTATSLESWLVNVSKGNHSQIALIQVSEIL